MIKKSLHTYSENRETQPLSQEVVFNRSDLLTCGWIPLTPGKKIKKNAAKSFYIFNQRIVIFRKQDGNVYALDAFCPHMGTDLGNGKVVDDRLQCYFHQWSFSEDGSCLKLKNKKLKNYATEEKYGFIWIFPDENAPFKVPHPPGMEDFEVEGLHLFQTKLFVHHHVLMAGGIDLQHFKSVHNLDIDFKYQTQLRDNNQSFIWSLTGNLPRANLLQKIAHYLTGGIFNYQALFSGGTITSLTYGNSLRFRGKGFTLPTTSIIWAATPHYNDVSNVDVFIILKKTPGFFGFIKKHLKLIFSLILLKALKDDDVKAFPNMRFDLTNPSEGDRSILDLVKKTNELNISQWSNNFKAQQ